MGSILGPSWRTKTGAIISSIAILCGQASTLLDDDSKTNPDFTVILGTFGTLYALLSARDNVVTSEKAGAKQ